MTFYLIGIGLNEKSISLEALEILRKCKKIYLENYTVEFPYQIFKIEEIIKANIIPLTRIMVEGEKFVEEAKQSDVALLVYGSPLTATTHFSLILKCREEKIPYKILHNASILDAVSNSGLQLYKFGKIASMPKWDKNYKPNSFIKILQDNNKIGTHSLVLVDIGLIFSEALKQLVSTCKKKVKIDKIIVCSKLGTEEERIIYNKANELDSAEIYPPFCFILPGELHFVEDEALEQLRKL